MFISTAVVGCLRLFSFLKRFMVDCVWVASLCCCINRVPDISFREIQWLKLKVKNIAIEVNFDFIWFDSFSTPLI